MSEFKSCKRSYVVGRWNDIKGICEYYDERNNVCRWDANLNLAEVKNWASNLHQQEFKNIINLKHSPIFICKVFTNTNRRQNSDIVRLVITLTKHNHWHHLEAMMDI